MPPLDDDLAKSASEFETFAELREDVESRLREQIEDEVETQFRANAADALVAASKVDAAGPLVESRTRELLHGVARQVEALGGGGDVVVGISTSGGSRNVIHACERARAQGRKVNELLG